MNKQELEDRIQAMERAVQEQREIVQNTQARKPAIREANYLEELLNDLNYLYSQRTTQ